MLLLNLLVLQLYQIVRLLTLPQNKTLDLYDLDPMNPFSSQEDVDTFFDVELPVIVKVLNKIPKKVIEQNKGDAFEVHGINVGIEAEGKYNGFKMLTREKREGGIPDFHASIFEALFNMEHKFGDSRGPQRGATVNFKTGYIY